MESETSTGEIKASKNQTSQKRKDWLSNHNDRNFIILPADKGKATVLMDKVEYFNKLADLIGSESY